MILWAIREGGDGVKNTVVLIVGTSRLLLAGVVEFIQQPHSCCLLTPFGRGPF